MNKTEEFILETLTNTTGWISARRLAELCGMGDRNLRRHVKELIEVHKEPIVSGDEGFKFCTDEAEKARFARRLAAHALSELKRSRALDAALVGGAVVGQLELRLGGDDAA